MSRLSSHRLFVPACLGALALIHGVVNLIWLAGDGWDVSRIPDGFVHAGSALHLSSGVATQGAEALGCVRDVHSFYPVLAHLPRAAAAALFGLSPTVLRLANLLYLLVLLVGVYKLGRRCLDRRAGLLAATLVSLMPAVYGGSRVVGLDFPALCLTPLAVYLLLRSDGFKRPGYAVAFGATAGLAALIKGQVLLFLFWPAALALVLGIWRSLKEEDAGPWWRTALGAGLTLVALAAASAVWWVGRFEELTRVLAGHATGKEMLFYESDPSVLGGVKYFLTTFPLLVTGPLSLVLVAAVVVLLRGRVRLRWELLAWIAIPLLLHMVLKVRHFRYLFPLVPAAAVLLGVGVYTLKVRWRHAVAGGLVALAVAMWLACSFSAGPPEGALHVTACVPQQQLQREPPGMSLLACGSCSYSGPSAESARHELYAQAGKVAGWLQRRHPAGQGLMLQFDAWRHPKMVPLIILLLERLPAAQVFMTGGVRTERLTPSTPPGGWHHYKVTLTPTAVPAAERVFRAPGNPDAATLWRLR